jgi:hypothetical protein
VPVGKADVLRYDDLEKGEIIEEEPRSRHSVLPLPPRPQLRPSGFGPQRQLDHSRQCSNGQRSKGTWCQQRVADVYMSLPPARQFKLPVSANKRRKPVSDPYDPRPILSNQYKHKPDDSTCLLSYLSWGDKNESGKSEPGKRADGSDVSWPGNSGAEMPPSSQDFKNVA